MPLDGAVPSSIQAAHADALLSAAVVSIDKRLGAGAANQHPALIAAWLNVAASTGQYSRPGRQHEPELIEVNIEELHEDLLEAARQYVLTKNAGKPIVYDSFVPAKVLFPCLMRMTKENLRDSAAGRKLAALVRAGRLPGFEKRHQKSGTHYLVRVEFLNRSRPECCEIQCEGRAEVFVGGIGGGGLERLRVITSARDHE